MELLRVCGYYVAVSGTRSGNVTIAVYLCVMGLFDYCLTMMVILSYKKLRDEEYYYGEVEFHILCFVFCVIHFN